MDEAHQESRLENERAARYLGTARIALKWLHIDVTEVSQKHVQVLKTRFAKDCCRLDPRNHIPAIINRQDFESALRTSSLKDDLLRRNKNGEFPDLIFWPDFKLDCLHGRHRLEAARSALVSSDRWWTVDLYRADLSADLRRCIAEEYSNEGKPCDGEIYRKIRKYQFDKRSDLETRWWTRLSKHRANNLKQLFQHEKFSAAFDSFLEIPAILDGLRISTMHKMFALRCDEEVLHYLGYIKTFWSELCSNNKSTMTKLDARTIEELQLRAPWASKTDSELLYQRISMGAVLCRFDQCERELILGKLRSFKGLIPSLYEFFENLKCLDAWAGGLRWLCCLGPRDTMSTALANIFSGGKSPLNTALVQTSESAFKTISANLPMQRELGVRQLYAFAMRNHREIPQKPRRNNLLANPIPLIDESKLRDLADLAHELGFQSMQITALRNRPKVASMAEEGANGQPRLVTDGPGELRKYRCGIPRAQHYEQDRCSYFIPYLHEAKDEQSNNITNFFRMRSVYLKFFGTLSPQTYHSLDADHLTFSLLSQVRLDESLHLASAIDQARHDSSKSVQQSTSKLSLENNTLEKISQELDRTRYQEQERQRLYFEQNQLAALKQENGQMREKISREQEALHKIHEDQKEKRQESCLERSDLLMLEQEQRRTRQRLIEEEKHLQKIEQDQECQRAELISTEVNLANLERQRAQEYQELSQKSSEITALEQKLINIQQKQKEQEQYLHSEAQRINESSPLRKTSSAAVQQQVTEASSSLVTTDPNVLTGHNSTDVAKIKMFDGSRVVSGPHTNKSEAVNSPEVRHGFTEASLSSTAKDEVRLCEPVQMAESGTVNNSEDTSQQCARHEFSTSASPAVIDNPETAKPRQVPETEALDDSEDIPTQCALTSPMELTPPATRRKVREAQSLRFAADQNVLRCESMEVTMTKPPRNHNLSAKTVMTGSPPPKRPQSDNHEEDVTTRMRQKGRNPTTNMKIQRLDHYRSIDRKDQED